jgi:hypothetical protein
MKSAVLILTFLFAISILPQIAFSTSTTMLESGRQIDVYTQYPAPYGGQGKDQPSNPFRPLMEVLLYANVSYNSWPVAQKIVSFQIKHGTWNFILSGTTNSSGRASVKFVLPWLNEETETKVIGIWNITATVDIAGVIVTDTLWFYASLSDLNSDGRVDIKDLAIVGVAYGSNPTLPKWNPTADVNHDQKVDILDLALVAKDYGWHM